MHTLQYRFMTNVPLMLTPGYSDIADFSPRSRQAVRCSTPCACRGYGIGRHARPVPALTGVAIASGVGRRVLAQLCVTLCFSLGPQKPPHRRSGSLISSGCLPPRRAVANRYVGPRASGKPRGFRRHLRGRRCSHDRGIRLADLKFYFPCLCPKSNRHASLSGVHCQPDWGKLSP
jgi:hypothetical protein